MTKLFYPDFFNDVFGPIMQPGSSGSFAGTSRVGRVAHYLIKSPLLRAAISFNPSDKRHLRNLGNMMDDRGYLGGLQDFAPDDARLFEAHTFAREKGISYEFTALEEENGYPGSVQFDLIGRDGRTGQLIGESVGGGMINIYEVNGYPIHWQADTFGLLVQDASGKYADQVTDLIDRFENEYIAQKQLKNKQDEFGYFIEFSSVLPEKELEYFFENADFLFLPALLPVVTTAGRKPQLFRTVDEWIELSHNRQQSFVQTAIDYEKDFSGWSESKIVAYFEKISGILNHQIHALEELGYENVPDTPLLPVYGKHWNRYKHKSIQLVDSLTSRIMDYAYSTNAKIPGVVIVPGPMGTGGGYLYSALEAVREARGFSHEKLIEGLIVAAGLGAIAFTHAHASGASGCVGESGICCAMASGAITWMAGGTGEQVQHAASMALQANIGIPCDPIPGGLEFPCLTRTVRAAVTAPMYADMALSGIDPLIPYHEVLYAIEKNRQQNQNAVCGPLCGVNCTLTAQKCALFLKDEVMGDQLKYTAPVN
ncbi:L-serine ammonia-lyase, iron-sulfur-dependent, subunit alpha [Sporolactobacillus shoreicorticis]|uniref:L-serine ammonia-lyase n=1 Tax=Sporolactobacillus shoreicorticis TaxID=1923877 RepID=A0ABW5S466_9BACL|nr:L-serine ammonia-lyase, iron-sulfur-dependent, subunit alpha [Sporolactobacillus shoreicorticis]MCO7124307.1 L-serine ammonia-lyase, iron-sulfur-dependent, subunit alpha [Sporolactobacillus shoreicorticis]